MKISEILQQQFDTNNTNIVLLIEMIDINQKFELLFNNSDTEINYNSNIYLPISIDQNLIFEGISNIKSQIEISIHKNNIKLNNIEQILNTKILIKISDYNNLNYASTIFKGYPIGYREIQNGLILITIGSIMTKLNFPKGDFFSETCRASLGDSQCGKVLNDMKKTGSIERIVSKDSILGNHPIMTSGYFDLGILKIISGNFQDKILKIKTENNNLISFLTLIPELKEGDQYEIYPGCNKTISICKKKFNNVVNFRGEPFIKGYKNI